MPDEIIAIPIPVHRILAGQTYTTTISPRSTFLCKRIMLDTWNSRASIGDLMVERLLVGAYAQFATDFVPASLFHTDLSRVPADMFDELSVPWYDTGTPPDLTRGLASYLYPQGGTIAVEDVRLDVMRPGINTRMILANRSALGAQVRGFYVGIEMKGDHDA